MSACTWKTSVSAASNGCCQRVRAACPGRDLHQLGAHPHPARCRPRPSPSAPCRSAGSPLPARGRSRCGRFVVLRYSVELPRAITSSPEAGRACPAPRRSRRRRSRRPPSRPGSRTGAPRARCRRRSSPAPGGRAARRTARRAPMQEPEDERASASGTGGRRASRATRWRARSRGGDGRAAGRRTVAARLAAPAPNSAARREPVGRDRASARWIARSTASGTALAPPARIGRAVSVNRFAHHRLRRRPGERRLARQHLVQHHRQRVDVGARVQLALARSPAPGSCRPASRRPARSR